MFYSFLEKYTETLLKRRAHTECWVQNEAALTERRVQLRRQMLKEDSDDYSGAQTQCDMPESNLVCRGQDRPQGLAYKLR